jgi:hypothetical protein
VSPALDVTPWNLLHDGVIVGLERRGAQLSVTVEIAYLRSRFSEPGDTFVLELSEADGLEYTPYDGQPVTAIEEISALEPEIVEAQPEGDGVVIWGSSGVLRLRYRSLALRFGTGAPLSVEALAEASRGYWDEWRRKTT